MIEAHLAMLRARDEISPFEATAITNAVSEVRRVPDNNVFIHRETDLQSSTLLLEGWMARVRDLKSGHRQMTELHVPGDFPDLHSFTLKRLDHDVVTLSPCRVAIVPHENLRRITKDFPHLTRVYWLLTNIDAAIHREWAVSMGRRCAISRMAHLICELFVRLAVVGEVRENSFDMPLSQMELGDALGISAVHTNRTVQELRRRKLIELEPRIITVLDWRGLVQLAEFNPSYLYFKRAHTNPALSSLGATFNV